MPGKAAGSIMRRRSEGTVGGKPFHMKKAKGMVNHKREDPRPQSTEKYLVRRHGRDDDSESEEEVEVSMPGRSEVEGFEEGVEQGQDQGEEDEDKEEEQDKDAAEEDEVGSCAYDYLPK